MKLQNTSLNTQDMVDKMIRWYFMLQNKCNNFVEIYYVKLDAK